MNGTEKITVIFPMAGRGERFGCKFKPFLEIEGSTFIQKAVDSFSNCLDDVKEIIFIFLDEQEKEHKVSNRLHEMFHSLNYRTVILDKPTHGPAETLRNAILQDGRISGKIMVCDCDHYIGVEPMFNYLREGCSDDCIIPLWNLRGENIKAWSVAALSDESYVVAVSEKELPKSPGSFFGIIGCYYFNNPSYLTNNNKIYVSEIIQDLIKNKKTIKGIRLFNAEFFGDPQRLQNLLDTKAKKKGTIFCDLDGTITEHEDAPSYDHPLKLLPGSLNKLKTWSNEGYSLILTTSRKSENEKELITALKEANIDYEQLIMNLPSGPRYLINDRKPSAMLTPHSIAFEVERNKGISHLEIDSTKPNILKMFKGGSLSKTLLVENSGKLFVRKIVAKNKEMNSKYLKLKKQFSDMQRLSKFCKEIIPTLYGETENSFEYYYDMEFLPDYDLLCNYSNAEKLKATKLLIQKMANKIYKPGAHSLDSGKDWLKNHFIEKIYPKLKEGELPSRLANLVYNDRVIIDSKQYSGLSFLLKKFMDAPYVNFIKPNYLCPIHGDLNFENILYKNNIYNISTNSYEPGIKLIDTDSIEFIDPPELDFGKIFQSVVSQYEQWSNSKESLVIFNNAADIYTTFNPNKEMINMLKEYISPWSGVIEGDSTELEIKGYFYMALHLIRMVPFRLAVSEDQGAYALILAIKSLSRALDLIKQKTESSNSKINEVAIFSENKNE